MGKNEFIQLEIIDLTQLQQKDVGGISLNENLILVEIADITLFGQDTRTDNMYQPLSKSASTPGRHIVGKHQASSPLEDDQTFKKHREDSSEHKGTFVSQITINPSPSSAQNIPMEQNDIPGH